jgi:D-alanyl-lipoteichoic acid acyltransferase DltB (MBOAT superfamily)
MLFNSLLFIVFFAVVLAFQWLPVRWRTRKCILLIASYIFYAAWRPPFVILLWISTLVDWGVARRLATARSRAARRGLLAASLGVNLGLLGYFKYAGFVTESLARALNAAGIPFSPPELSVVLPIGISFYTFQTLSYTLDVYFGRGKPWHSFLDYALYVTFFPQLVAGPIVRAFDFLPQCEEPKRATAGQLSWGLTLLLIGLFEKIVVADGLLAPVADRIYGATRFDGIGAWVGTLAFSGQILCDFLGYSTCAVGAGMCLGFALPDNFHCPYAAIGFSDFWRRWHISLSTWLRDYLYIPLGGNRGSKLLTLRKLVISLFLGGLWHGAAWKFVAWGLLHGIYLVAERLVKDLLPRSGIWTRPTARLCLGLLTFALVCVAWVFFRAESVSEATAVLAAMAGFGSRAGEAMVEPSGAFTVIATMVVMLALQWTLRDSSLEAAAARVPRWLAVGLMAAMLVATCTMTGPGRAFIYFQF